MNKFAKRTVALACAALMAAGGLVQASASDVVGKSFHGAIMTGKAARTNSTTVTAITSFVGKDSAVTVCTPYVRGFANVNGSRQYGGWKHKDSFSVKDEVDTTAYISAGVPLSGYGGQHYLYVTILNPSGGAVTHDTSVIKDSTY